MQKRTYYIPTIEVLTLQPEYRIMGKNYNFSGADEPGKQAPARFVPVPENQVKAF